jgi:hypothetical protein
MTHRYRFISEHHASYGVTRLCRVLAVRRQGYYEWLAARPARAQRAEAEDQPAAEIRAVHGEHKAAYGSPRIAPGCAAAAGGSTVSASSGSCASTASSVTPGADAGR